jgi:hypothetical protein
LATEFTWVYSHENDGKAAPQMPSSSVGVAATVAAKALHALGDQEIYHQYVEP